MGQECRIGISLRDRSHFGEALRALEPQFKALDLANESVTRRIEALLEVQALQSLAEGNDDHRELLARTVEDELALAEIDDLTARARLIEEALRAGVEQARRTCLSLVPKAS